MRRILTSTMAATTSALVLATTSCSLVGSGDDDRGTASERVVLVTHESFVMSEELQQEFEDASGYDLVVRASGDAGSLTNKLVLTEDDPIGDVVFGIDNTFGSRAVDEGVLAPYAAPLPDGAEQYLLAGDDEQALTPVDHGSVCVNVDTAWFADNGIPEPETLDDLLDPQYADLFVTPGATTSSPGLAFLLATIADTQDWPAYWEALMANGAKVVPGWSEAYEVDFTQGGGGGDRPIVLSYDSSPAFTIGDDGQSTTRALLDTCIGQVEYVGVLAGAANEAGGRALVDFMLARGFQEALPESMYVFPVDAAAALPPDWADFAVQPNDPLGVDPAEIAANRETWLREWSDIVSR